MDLKYRHCNCVEDVLNQVGKLKNNTVTLIKGRFEMKKSDWHEDLIFHILMDEIRDAMTGNFKFSKKLKYVIIGSRVNNWFLGLDEANTLFALTLLSEMQTKNGMLLDLFIYQEFEVDEDDDIIFKEKPTVQKEDKDGKNILRELYDMEDKVTGEMYNFLLQGRKVSLEGNLDGTKLLQGLIN